MSKSNSNQSKHLSRSRREFLAQGAVGAACLLSFTIGGCERKLTPAEARAAEVPLRTLDPPAVTTLESLGEILLPGSAQAGLAQFIDHQLSGDPADSMLMIKYLRVEAPFKSFYLQGLGAARDASMRRFGKPLDKLDAEEGNALVHQMSGGQIEGWHGPPAALFYFVLRNDAVDVMFGTPSGFETLGVPYMPHIMPSSRWG
jgi:Gluconate 2-dehydrogenase subunit 3